MPEVLTKHPKIVKKILNESGAAQCGVGARQKILKECPKENFCALKTGELCVYGLDEVETMTQFGKEDICSRSGKWHEGKAFFVAGLFLIAGTILTMVLLKRKH